MDKKAAADKADQLIEMTGLTGFENALPHELSGGMQQRVSLCRALLHEPEILQMDEPFGALGALTREKIERRAAPHQRETGTTVMLVTHSVFLTNRTVVMSRRSERIVDAIEVPPGAPEVQRDDGAAGVHLRANTVRELLGATSVD
ncbi:ATP-binding cassette domain-containing protein [Rhodococcoides corynebacterioides]|uniref:ATP-binding cassette domain-containing protein n=1 Tax=Rhodococcoides corynebacterioides TaxID=53972 RepID=UPI0021BF9EC2|nr:ATP-binding cassette domain-containing protein [Rhodococcus corynebacterioides]